MQYASAQFAEKHDWEVGVFIRPAVLEIRQNFVKMGHRAVENGADSIFRADSN